MADTTTLADARTAPVVSDDDVTHAVCHCNADLGLCGTDVSEAQWDTHVEIPCPICFTLMGGPCPHCGCAGCPEGWEAYA